MRTLMLPLCLILAACVEDVVEAPPPIAMTETALGHYCQMELIEHAGPKGQIHLAGLQMPIWFSQVRDAVAYVKSEERSAAVLAVYVSDMAEAGDWQNPGTENWIDAREAFFVIGSDAIGGMGAPELVPFAEESEAQVFAESHGGSVHRLAEIEPDVVLSPVEITRRPDTLE